MARRTFAAPFVLLPIGALAIAQGCTQDFSTFDPTGAGGGATGSTSSAATTTSSSTTTTTTTSTTSTATNAGGGGEGPTTSSTGGGQGGEGGAGGQGGTGGGECTVDIDCEDGNPCTSDACDVDTCIHTNVADGPLVEDPEDCRTITCVAGVVNDVPNDAEDPGDVNPPCETTICSGGAVTAVLASDTTPCGPSPQFCDGAGTCVGCDPDPPDNECGADTLCSQPSCIDPGVCDPGYLPANTPLVDPTDGDCQDAACTGDSAAPVSVPDNSDLPADLPCGDRGCSGGAPTTTTLTNGTACIGESGFCDGLGTGTGNCRFCRDTQPGTTADAGCSNPTPVCDQAAAAGEGACGECTSDAHCGADVCDEPNRVCVECLLDADCTLGVCDTGSDQCVECLDDGDCAVVCDEGSNLCAPCLDLGPGFIDDGCGGPTPACDVGTGCVECQDAQDCIGHPNGDDCSENGGTECGCDMDNDCNGNRQGEDCQGTACGCDNVNDCDHPTSDGELCLGTGVCGCAVLADCPAAALSCTNQACVYP